MKTKFRYIDIMSCLSVFMLMLCLLIPSVNVNAQEKKQGSNFGTPVVLPEVTVEGKTMDFDINGCRLQCNLYGKGTPVIVMITGFGSPQSYWAPILDKMSQVSAVFTYDRMGYGNSEYIEDGKPIDGMKSAKDLRLLLEKAKIAPPYVIVGHSMGCGIARLFCSSYPDLVSGLILEDPGHEDLKEAHRAIMKEDELATFKKMESGMPRNLSGAMKQEYLANDITGEQLRNSPPLPEIPLVVVSSGTRRAPPMFSDETQQKWIATGLNHIKKLAKLVPDGKHVVLEKAGHNIHFDDPVAFVDIVENVVKEAQ